MSWVLMMFVVASNKAAIHTTEGFTSQAACERAAVVVTNVDIGWGSGNMQAVCFFKE